MSHCSISILYISSFVLSGAEASFKYEGDNTIPSLEVRRESVDQVGSNIIILEKSTISSLIRHHSLGPEDIPKQRRVRM